MLLIDSIRKHASAWYTKIFLGLLALCFVILWGGGDLLRQGFMGHGQNIITVGGTTVSIQEFQQDFNRALRNYTARTGQNISVEDAKKMGVDRQVLQGLIQKTLLDMEADRLGLVITDETLRDITHENTIFHDQTGQFSKEKFYQILQKLNLSESRYIAEVRGDLRRSQLITAITAGIVLPQSMVDKLYKWQHEKRQIKIIPVLAKSVSKVSEPSEKDLKDFYETNPSQLFTEPERRSISAIIFERKNAKVNIDADKIAEIYNSRAESDFAGKSLMQVTSEIEKEIERDEGEKALNELRTKIEDEEASGKSLKEIAEQFNLNLLTMTLVDRQGNAKDVSSSTPEINHKELILETAFGTDAEETSDTILAGVDTYLIVHVDQVTPTQKIPYEDVKSKVKEKWIEGRRLIQADENAKNLAGEINKTGNKAMSGHTIKTLIIERQGGEEFEKSGIDPALLGRIFTLDTQNKAINTISKSEAGSLVVIYDKVIPVENKKDDKAKQFQNNIYSMMVNDVVENYLVTLQNRYKVEVNKNAFKSS